MQLARQANANLRGDVIPLLVEFCSSQIRSLGNEREALAVLVRSIQILRAAFPSTSYDLREFMGIESAQRSRHD